MGCFFACFGSSNDRKTRKQRHKVRPRFQKNSRYNAQSTVFLDGSDLENPISSVNKVRDDKAEKQLSSDSIAQKKLTFDSKVQTYDYEHVLFDKSTGFELHNDEEGEKKGKVKEENLAATGESEISSEHSLITPSSSSYPPNHRYQNCRGSDDEDHELDFEECDLDVDDAYEDFDDGSMESRERIRGIGGVTKEADGLVEEEAKPIGLVRGGRDRSGSVNSVLNPVENLTQWKAVKAKGATPLKLQKENLSIEQEELRLSSSLDPSFKELSSSTKSKSEHEMKKLNEEVSVSASLSSSLSSTETTPAKESTTFASSSPKTDMSQGSNSRKSPEDRPILGALTLEEIKKFSASSPRRSPSPDEMPIIGTVGTYWSHASSTKDSGSANSFKGIPNTTSKYREDNKVNWNSTPFETRLERALNKDSAEVYSNSEMC